jgi:hypothetical protein
MPEQDDPFTGTWKFNAELSKLSMESPRSWFQRIVATSNEVDVRETIVRSDGSETLVSLRAKFDGREYPVHGSLAADTIAYARIDRNSISATGRKNGVISLTETVTVDSESDTLTLTYSLHRGREQVSSGIAVFERSA